VIGLAAYVGYGATKALDSNATVEEARTTATLVVLIVALTALVLLARPLAGWKLGLVAAMIGIVVFICAVPALAHGIYLMELSPQRVATAVVVGATGSLLLIVATGLVSKWFNTRQAGLDSA
jgi:cation-transporting ATPase E